MYFDINNYKGKYVMHCKTEEEANDFCRYLNFIGRKWYNGSSYLNNTSFYIYNTHTAYYFNEGVYGGLCNARANNYTILEWEDFMKHTFTKADLKTGDIVKQRDGIVQVFIKELNVFITKDGFNNSGSFKNDLTHKYDHDFDIVAVRRPVDGSDCQFTAFDRDFGYLVYERQEVEEMTLEQVCKLLGKEIKIIK